MKRTVLLIGFLALLIAAATGCGGVDTPGGGGISFELGEGLAYEGAAEDEALVAGDALAQSGWAEWAADETVGGYSYSITTVERWEMHVVSQESQEEVALIVAVGKYRMPDEMMIRVGAGGVIEYAPATLPAE